MKTKFFIIVLLSLQVSLFFVTTPIRAVPIEETTESFICVADSYVDSANPNTNYGSADLRVSHYSALEIYEVAYLAFTVSGLPADAAITEVRLEISVKSMPLDDHTVQLGIWETGAFQEYTITWNNMPGYSLETARLVSFDQITEDTRWAFKLSEQDSGENLKRHNVRGNGNYYFMCTTGTDNMWAITFDSRDDPWNSPTLAITYEYTPKTTPKPTITTFIDASVQSIRTVNDAQVYTGTDFSHIPEGDLPWLFGSIYYNIYIQFDLEQDWGAIESSQLNLWINGNSPEDTNIDLYRLDPDQVWDQSTIIYEDTNSWTKTPISTNIFVPTGTYLLELDVPPDVLSETESITFVIITKSGTISFDSYETGEGNEAKLILETTPETTPIAPAPEFGTAWSTILFGFLVAVPILVTLIRKWLLWRKE